MFDHVDDKALQDMWGQIERRPFERHRITLDRTVAAYHRDDAMHNVLTYLKLFPTHKNKFETSVQAMLTFCDVIVFIRLLSLQNDID